MKYENNTLEDLSFKCAFEAKPQLDERAEILFNYAHWLQKNNQLPQDKIVDVEIERLYRIAAEHGHYKANVNLQNGTRKGFFKLKAHESVRLTQDLIDTGVATGYYLIGIFLQNGSAGLEEDQEMALRYFRKAADLGSGEAQDYVGKKLIQIAKTREVGWQMRRCAAEQGVGKAALALGVHLSGKKEFDSALYAYQLGVAAGNENSASFLRKGFLKQSPSNEILYLGQKEDLERAGRYTAIWRILANYSYANPKVPEINEIVPLPPAPLPEWDGKLQWLEARLANIPPEKPSEELIKRLADEKRLEPATGRPMPGAAGFDQSKFPVKGCFSGQVCPQTGYWKAMWLPHEARGMLHSEVIRHVKEGEIMPTHFAERYFVRSWPVADKHTVTEERVHWGLLG